MSAPSPGGTPPIDGIPSQSEIDALESARVNAIRAWAAEAAPRELPRIGQEPNGEKDWLRSRGIEDGEWLTSMKPQFKAGMRPGNPLKERVWNCGILATAGYKGELAVKLVNGKLRTATSNDIRKQTNRVAEEWATSAGFDLTKLTDQQRNKLHATKQDFRRAMAALEAEGRALRTDKDGTPVQQLPPGRRKSLHEGDVLLFFFFFRPFQEKPGLVVNQCLPKFVSSSAFSNISRMLKLLGLDLDTQTVGTNDYLRDELEAAAEDYQKGKQVVLERAQKRVLVAAQGAHKETNIVSNELKGTGAAAAVSSDHDQPPPPSDLDPVPESIEPILEAVKPIGVIDDETARSILVACRQEMPDVTVGEVAARVPEVPIGRGARSPIGILRTGLPKLFKGESGAKWRRERNAQNTPRPPTSPSRWENEGMWIADKDHWDDLSEAQRVFYSEMFPDEAPGLTDTNPAS